MAADKMNVPSGTMGVGQQYPGSTVMNTAAPGMMHSMGPGQQQQRFESGPGPGPVGGSGPVGGPSMMPSSHSMMGSAPGMMPGDMMPRQAGIGHTMMKSQVMGRGPTVVEGGSGGQGLAAAGPGVMSSGEGHIPNQAAMGVGHQTVPSTGNIVPGGMITQDVSGGPMHQMPGGHVGPHMPQMGGHQPMPQMGQPQVMPPQMGPQGMMPQMGQQNMPQMGQQGMPAQQMGGHTGIPTHMGQQGMLSMGGHMPMPQMGMQQGISQGMHHMGPQAVPPGPPHGNIPGGHMQQGIMGDAASGMPGSHASSRSVPVGATAMPGAGPPAGMAMPGQNMMSSGPTGGIGGPGMVGMGNMSGGQMVGGSGPAPGPGGETSVAGTAPGPGMPQQKMAASMPPVNQPANGGQMPSESGTTNMGGQDVVSASGHGMPGTEPAAPPPDASSRQQPAIVMTQMQMQQLRAQILTYRYLARNQPLPENIRLAAEGKRPFSSAGELYCLVIITIYYAKKQRVQF